MSTEFDFITDEDPSTFSSLKYLEKREAELPAKHDDILFREAYVFEASFSDNTRIKLFVDGSLESVEAAEVESRKFVHPLGKLPTILRKGVDRLCLHRGGAEHTAFADVGLIVMYADNATVRISNHDLEETLFHESVHAAWDKEYATSEKWQRAQASDGNFVTLYARSKPEREDLAESALFAYTLLHHPGRLPPEVGKSIRAAIPARILFVADLLPPDKPVHFDVESLKKSSNEQKDR